MEAGVAIKPPEDAAERAAHDRRPLGSRFQDTCSQTRNGGGLPEGSIIPPGITDDLVLQIDLPARKAEREERLLAFHGGDVNATLADACREGGGKDALFLLEQSEADANHEVEQGWPLLAVASVSGHLTVVDALLDAGAGALDISLVYAAKMDRRAVVERLLDGGADVHFHDDLALRCAAGNGFLETSTLLLDRGADANAPHLPGYEETFLAMLQRCGLLEVAALLVARGAVG